MNNIHRKRTWSSQTQLGDYFGISAKKVGSILNHHGLRHGRRATNQAIQSGWAMLTPLRDGTPHYLWNSEKVVGLIGQHYVLLDEVDYWVQLIQKRFRGFNRLLRMGKPDEAHKLPIFDDLPNSLYHEVMAKISQQQEAA